MKMVFMGTPEFAVPCLEKLISSHHEVVSVVTQPDRPHGRGRKLAMPAVKEAALRHGIPVLQPERVREPYFQNYLQKIAPEIIIVVAFGQILPISILQIPLRGCVNVHASLLPRYRGAAPIQRAVIQGEETTGVTTMQLDPGMDTGPILLSASTPIDLHENAGELSERLSQMGADLLIDTLSGLASGFIQPVPQDSSQATYASTLSRNDGEIDWRHPSLEIHNRVRGCNPKPGAFTFFQEGILKLWKTNPIPDEVSKAQPGTIISIDKKCITLSTGKGLIQLLEVQPEARKRMTGTEFARGRGLQVGDLLSVTK